MKKSDAQLVIELIHSTEPFPGMISVEKVVQSTVNRYIDNLIKNDPELQYKTIKSHTERKTRVFIGQFELAFRRKLKKILNEHSVKADPIPEKEEKKYLIKDAAALLQMTTQNLNHLLRKHHEIKVIEVSQRKRYLTESEINKLKRL